MRTPKIDPTLKRQALEKIAAKCPLCAASKRLLKLDIIKETDDAELMHIKCTACQAAMVTLIFSTGSMISSIGLITDLTRDDTSRFQNNQKLSENDLIELHEELEQHNLIALILKQTINH